MATLSSGRFYTLVDRLFSQRKHADHIIFDILRVEFSAIRALAQRPAVGAAEVDDAWLRRVELRRTEDVVAMLERRGFLREDGKLAAVFLDEKCGFIEFHIIGRAAELMPNLAIATILRLASACHASAILLATHDLAGETELNPDHRKLSLDLRRKGEAVDTFLLDHFVLTPSGWKRMFGLKRGRD